jgi:lactate dehydrogenase-like 2-hydroxyacid dehydrogenase
MKTLDILVPGALPATTVSTLEATFACHRAEGHGEVDAIVARLGDRIRGMARGGHFGVGRDLIDRLPKLEIIANFGVGYDGIDLARCAERGIVVTNTPDVLTEEVADTALGLLINTVRELPKAEAWLRDGRWARDGNYRLTRGSLRGRKAGIFGMGRIGLAIARRLEAFGLSVSYHNRRKVEGVSYDWYPSLVELARNVDTLISVAPGGSSTEKAVDRSVLEALGPDGVFVNIGRGSTVDEEALATALEEGTIMAAGLDVFRDEPHVPPRLVALDNACLLPHVGSASVHTRTAMGQLMIDNLASWFRDGRPLTPVPETPWPPRA